MKTPDWAKPAIFGAVGGAIAAIAIGFIWGGWVTAGTATKMERASAKTAITEIFTPLCVAEAQKEPEKIQRMLEERSWNQDNFVVEAGWVDNVTEKHRRTIAVSCAAALAEAAKTD
ncbi:hypothetical protein SAMN05216241_1171 [Limimonas halophila]|uniref:Uncharacterized protein n=2 Tax=Limimonas halophila TaxID=1082479 RepID=A0A1G7UTT5_9PROT|nr:hypothetical protein SAMN05216241_1171 [Limimonas halophila]